MDTRSRIIVAAMELFWEKGFNSTSVADVLSRSQVNSGSLYHLFPGKQDVLIGVLEAYRDGIGEMLLARRPGTGSTTRSTGSSRCWSAIAATSSRPTAPTVARLVASPWN
jgi:AcrR family transcriptional regulator